VNCQDSDPSHVYNCNMGGLPDLNTGSEHVQDTIAAFFNHLLDLGVAGVRIDAAKHINPAEMSSILSKVSQLRTIVHPCQGE
jgi:alpha-amylase